MTHSSLIYLVLLLAGITLLVIYSRSGSILKSVIFTCASGFIALGAVLLVSKFINLSVAITPLSLLISGILGAPGVFAMLVINLL